MNHKRKKGINALQQGIIKYNAKLYILDFLVKPKINLNQN